MSPSIFEVCATEAEPKECKKTPAIRSYRGPSLVRHGRKFSQLKG